MQENRLSILSRLDSTKIYLDPYPHIVIKDALDPAIFDELQKTFPGPEIVTDGRTVRDTWYDYAACKVLKDQRLTPLWREFFDYHVSGLFFQELVEKLGPVIRELHPDLEKRTGKSLRDFAVGMRPGGRGDPLAPGADISMECQFYLNFTQRPRIVRGPHVDRPSELFAALLYFRQDGDEATGGDLEVNRARPGTIAAKDNRACINQLPMEIDPAKVETARTIRYEANTLVLFLNSARSIHAVTPRSPTPITRRHINFCGDLNVDLFALRLPPRLALKQALQKAPMVWRLAKYI